MAHHKNRKPKGFKGHCWMCAPKDHELGVRNKRVRTLQELVAPAVEEGYLEIDGPDTRVFLANPEDGIYPDCWGTCCGCEMAECRLCTSVSPESGPAQN